MNQRYDAIVIGAGHNGLVTAALLAKAGYRVLVLERRDVLGGAAATEEVFPGFRFNTGAHDAALFRDEVVNALNLQQHGLEFISSAVKIFAPQPNYSHVTLWNDLNKTLDEIATFSIGDVERYATFTQMMDRLGSVLDSMVTLTPPNLAGKLNVRELYPWARTALSLRRLGKRDTMEFLRVLPMSARELLDEWFESDALKGLFGAMGVRGSMQGPYASGTAFMMLYHRLGATKFVRGGIGRLSNVLAEVARKHGAEIRTGVEVQRVAVKDGVARGVVIDGETITARVVVSNADARRTLFGLVGPAELAPREMRRVRNVRYRGSTAKINLALSALPEFVSHPDGDYLSGCIVIAPSLEYIERAYDEAKYGRFSTQPALDITVPTVLDPSLAPEGQHIMSITMQYAPYRLREGDWDEQREALGDCVIDTLAAYMTNLHNNIMHRQVITPLDWEREYGLTEGSITHGQMGLDQVLFMRPIAGYGQYRMPIEHLYLCGAGAHPGGGVTGAPGYNAAREIMKDLKGKA